MLVANEENNLIGSLVTDSPSITETLHFLEQLKKRANFNAKVCTDFLTVPTPMTWRTLGRAFRRPRRLM